MTLTAILLFAASLAPAPASNVHPSTMNVVLTGRVQGSCRLQGGSESALRPRCSVPLVTRAAVGSDGARILTVRPTF